MKKAMMIGAVVCAACFAAAGAERPFTVVPMCIGLDAKTEDVASAILGIHARSGVDRFVLHGPGHGVRTSGFCDEEGYRGLGRRVKAVQDAVAEKGIRVGFLMGPMMNVGINHPWTRCVCEDGRERPFTACPGDPDFRKAFAAHCAAVAAECRPFLYMMEDDFRLFGGRGCHCARHKANPGRAMEDLVLLAGEAARAIHRASPETRIGLSAPGGYLQDAARLAHVLADGGRPFIRWYGTDYGFDVPMRLPDFLWTPLWAKQNISGEMDCVYGARSRLLVHATQLSCDACETLSFVVAPPYRGGCVEVLDKGEWKRLAEAWRDGRLVLPRTLHLYDTMVVKICLVCGTKQSQDEK